MLRISCSHDERSQQSFCCGWSGNVLDPCKSLEAAGIEGDNLTAVAVQRLCYGGDWIITWGHTRTKPKFRRVQQLNVTDYAFAAILADGSVVTWGEDFVGGESSAVQLQLRSVQQVQGTARAFAAVLKDGSVSTWGNHAHGGDSSRVQDQVHATDGAFLAILADGSVVTWGNPQYGGKSFSVQDQLAWL